MNNLNYKVYPCHQNTDLRRAKQKLILITNKEEVLAVPFFYTSLHATW